MMAPSFPSILRLAGRLSYGEIFSRKKAQKAQRSQEMDNRGALIEKLLQPADSNARGSADINRLCDIIRQTSFEIHKFLRSGHLEKIYENALAHRLTKIGIEVVQFFFQAEDGIRDLTVTGVQTCALPI